MLNNKITSIDILGTKISVTNYSSLLTIISTRIRKRCDFVCVASVHSLMESLNDKRLQKGMNKSLVTTTDGMPLVWIAKSILKRRVTRVYGPDLMLKLCKLSQKRHYKVFLLGGFNGLSQTLKTNLLKKYPGLKIVGSQEVLVRPIPKKANRLLIKRLKSLNVDIVFVGMGCPWQEKWMIENHEKLSKGLFVGVGAAFDFVSKRVKQAPDWMQNRGLEWFFRFLQEPRRLWRRYVIMNAKFIILVVTKYKDFFVLNDKEI